MFSYLFVVVLTKLTYSSLSLLSILITSVWNSTSSKLLVCILFSYFLEFCSVLSLGTCFFVSSFQHPPRVAFYLLGTAAMSPGLRRVTLCTRCPVRSSGTVFPIPQTGSSRCIPVWVLSNVVVVESLDCCWHINGRDLALG